MSAPQPLLKIEKVSKEYAPGGGAPPVAVLRDITLEVCPGESLAIIGPSGCGKSTLLNIIGTLDRPSAGRVWFAGRDLSEMSDLELAALRNQQLGFVFQSHHLLPHCSVWENVLVPTLAASGRTGLRPVSPPSPSGTDSKTVPRPPGAEAASRAERLLKRVGLGDRLHHHPGQLSGGERQRVAVVRALINRPQLLLADEPTGALDRASAESLGRLLVELNREEGVTLIVVTHALDLARCLGRAFELRDGALLAKALPEA
jgi:lipoprotein-releasing system ATP-binding protein